MRLLASFFFNRAKWFVLLSIAFVCPTFSQSINLSLSSGSGLPGSTVSLNLLLTNTTTGGQPASLQFTLLYDSTDVITVNARVGAVATAAGKSVSCSVP